MKELVNTEKILKDAGAIWEAKFSKKGTFQQKGYMSDPSMKMKIQKGIRQSFGNSELIELDTDTIKTQLNYQYKITDEI